MALKTSNKNRKNEYQKKIAAVHAKCFTVEQLETTLLIIVGLLTAIAIVGLV